MRWIQHSEFGSGSIGSVSFGPPRSGYVIADCILINPGTRLIICTPRKSSTIFSSYQALLV